MSSDISPPSKKMKTSETLENFTEGIQNSKQNLKAVLNDDIFEPIPLTKVYAGYVKEKKKLSHIILVLNEKMPLKQLQHLKRVHKSEVLLCQVDVLAGKKQSIEEYLKINVPELSDTFEYIKEVEVAQFPPKTKEQNSECSKKWICNFHPNKYLEKLISCSFFNETDLIGHRTYISIAFEILKYSLTKKNLSCSVEDIILSELNTAIVVDPLINSVVAISLDNRQEHPIQHASMIAIDNVAKTQNGGAWNTNSNCDIDYLKKKFATTKFGFRKYLNKKEMVEKEQLDCPYLCTNYYIYLVREPCAMCAMGLVHARIKRVFFCFPNKSLGALKSKCKLHCVSSLNHHFEVFSGFQS